jgi:hypothetical protein
LTRRTQGERDLPVLDQKAGVAGKLHRACNDERNQRADVRNEDRQGDAGAFRQADEIQGRENAQ